MKKPKQIAWRRSLLHLSASCCCSFIVLIGALIMLVPAFAMQSAPPDELKAFEGEKLEWTRIDPQQVAEVLQMLADQVNGNLEKIRTWQGTYRVSMQEPLSKEYVESWPRGSLGDKPASALTRHTRFVMRFALDYPSDSVFLSKETVSTQLFRQDSDQEVIVEGGTPVDNNSVITAEHYLHMSPSTVWPQIGFLPEHPETQGKRAAFRESVDASRGKQLGDLMDPRDFFGFVPGALTYGDELSLYAANRRGDNGEKEKNRVWNLLELYKATRDGEILYRLVSEMAGNPPNYVISIWDSTVGFHPVEMVTAIGKDGSEPIQEVRTEWKLIDDIFVPARVVFVAYKLQYKRDATLEKCILNQPLDPHQFDYLGLGLKDGELIVDKIENVVYVMKDGAPEKLANFNAPYVPPMSERLANKVPSTRTLMIVATVALIAVLLMLIWRRRAAGA